ncbi:MAG: epoxyqueuosine reductase QueH [Thermodesulfovibrionia bacterium]
MKILLQICCANCAAYPSKKLRDEGHKLTGFWFNPNIQPYEEYKSRLNSLKNLADRWRIDMIYIDEYPVEGLSDTKLQNENCKMKIANLQSTAPNKAYDIVNRDIITDEPNEIFGQPERCKACYRLRLKKTAEEASKQGFDAFTTTLLISPYQDFDQITAIGNEIADKYNVLFYLRDFRPDFRKSMAIAKELGLYRQRYCGCIFSKEERERAKGKRDRLKHLNDSEGSRERVNNKVFLK